MSNVSPWHVSEDCKATLLLCHEFGGRRVADDAQPLTIWEYGQLVRFLRELDARPSDLLQAETAEPILNRLPIELPAERVRALLARGLSLSLSLETWRSRGIWVISRADSEYPSRLKDRFRLEAPPVLFGVGVPIFLNSGGIGVFGSRNVDIAGETFAKQVGQMSAKEDLTVLSGCARGVDWAAMSGCLENGGRSIGVVAEKLDRAAVSAQYRNFIREERLVLVSMFAPEAPFLAAHAKGRDKYTYALSDYGLVVASEVDKGGTWAGATEQLKRLRHVPVFVRNENNAPQGNRALIALGGKAFPALTDVESLKQFLGQNKTKTDSTEKSHVVESLPAQCPPSLPNGSEEMFALSPGELVDGKKGKGGRRAKNKKEPVEKAASGQFLVQKKPSKQVSDLIRVSVSGEGEGVTFWNHLGGVGEVQVWLDFVNFAEVPLTIDRVLGDILVNGSPIGRIQHLERQRVDGTSFRKIFVRTDLSLEQIERIRTILKEPRVVDSVGFHLIVHGEIGETEITLRPSLTFAGFRFMNFRSES